MGNQDYEWDESKRISNLAKHGLDFLDAPLIFEGLHLLGSGHIVENEVREIATGLIGEHVATAVFTRREQVIRIISLRRANNGEKRRYQAFYGN